MGSVIEFGWAVLGVVGAVVGVLLIVAAAVSIFRAFAYFMDALVTWVEKNGWN